MMCSRSVDVFSDRHPWCQGRSHLMSSHLICDCDGINLVIPCILHCSLNIHCSSGDRMHIALSIFKIQLQPQCHTRQSYIVILYVQLGFSLLTFVDAHVGSLFLTLSCLTRSRPFVWRALAPTLQEVARSHCGEGPLEGCE